MVQQMKPEFKWKYLAAIAAILIFGLFQVAAWAQETSTIKISYVGEGIEFKLYKVGEISSNEEVTLTGDFSGYSVSFDKSEAAQTLAAYVLRDKIIPMAKSKTNSEYNVLFSGLNRGVYLITGNKYTSGKKKYTALPVIVSVLNDKDNRNILVNGKYEVKDISTPSGGGSPSDGITEISVIKVWKGGTVKSDVTVQLLRDGTVYNEVVLNSVNNWRKTWNGLSDSYSWTVVEKTVAEGYEVSIEKDGSVFIITNTYKPTIPGKPDNPNNPNNEYTTETTTATKEPKKSEEPEVPETSVTSVTSDTPDDSHYSENNPNDLTSPKSGQIPPDEEKKNVSNKLNRHNTPTHISGSEDKNLPQTGQLWWPVPIFACIGILFIIIGIGYRREEECL